MGKWKSEAEAREEIKNLVAEYYHRFKEQKKDFEPGDRVSYASRVFDEKEMLSLTDATLDFWLTTGRFADEFEKKFAEWIGVKRAYLVNSGSSANLLAFMTLTAPELGERQIKRGEEVITVACGFPTTVTPILQYGAVPVFLDVTVPEYNIDVSHLEDALSEKTKAVMIAHTLGNPFNLEVIKKFCDKHHLWLIEDNCDALGSRYTIDGETRFTGTWGDIGTSSFYPPHHMTMGEGGCVYTNDSKLGRLILSYRDWGRDCICPSGQDNFCKHRFSGQYGQLPKGYDHKYTYSHFGYNLKVTDMQAAVGVEQLKKFPSFIEKRKANWAFLKEALFDIEGLILPEPAKNADPSWFGFLLSVKEESGVKRNDLTAFLEKANIQTRLLFSGNLIKHPCFDQIRGTDAYRVVGELKNTDYIMEHSFWIGVYPGMTKEMLQYMADKIHEGMRECKKN
ncbi:lipopolysaccharide biosynthesis protein RfbH [Oribacterium parvum]|uniref:lipopolysaccharide biosynthesis protein RfbH n=1 Tax=Oribacterium parvum TaxID=1501329 RepID=UPI0028E2CA9B|nr:lipopolysaccharide biosynthesis protein RfbH [Oribacterium parvum]